MPVKDRLAQLVQHSGLTHSTIAERIGVTDDWVGNRVRGVTNIAADDVPKLADALGVSPSDFFEETKVEEKVGSAVIRALRELPESEKLAMLGLAEREKQSKPRGGKGKPTLAEIWARGRVRQWEQLPESKQRRILEIMEELEESTEGQSQS